MACLAFADLFHGAAVLAVEVAEIAAAEGGAAAASAAGFVMGAAGAVCGVFVVFELGPFVHGVPPV